MVERNMLMEFIMELKTGVLI